jgi:hypothetical protein
MELCFLEAPEKMLKFSNGWLSRLEARIGLHLYKLLLMM